MIPTRGLSWKRRNVEYYGVGCSRAGGARLPPVSVPARYQRAVSGVSEGLRDRAICLIQADALRALAVRTWTCRHSVLDVP